MRNFLGALVGALMGTSLIVAITGLAPPSYPAPLDLVWFVLAGSESLLLSVLDAVDPTSMLVGTMVWIAMGVIAGLVATSRWNVLRSVLWMGVLVAVLGLVSLFAISPDLWFQDQAVRNTVILYRFVTTLLLSLVSVLGALPVAMAITTIRKKSLALPPGKIETICECGAIFKSKPLMCSECGRFLSDNQSK